MKKILAKIESNFGDTNNIPQKLKDAIQTFSNAMQDYLEWKQSPRGRAYSKAHPIERKEIINRLKKK